jgi:hypothetical protein
VVFHSAAVVIVTGGSVGLGRIVADPGFWNANTHVMALAECFADHGRGAYTGAVHASIIGSAEVAVITPRTVGLVTEITFAGLGITERCDLALIGLRALHIGHRCADAGRAFLSEGAKASIVASSTIFFTWIGADTGTRVADTRYVAIVQRGAYEVFTTTTDAVQACFVRCTGIIVIAG